MTCGEVAYLRVEVEPELRPTRLGRPDAWPQIDWHVEVLASGAVLGYHSEPDLPNATLTVLIPGGWRHDASARARVEGVVRRFAPGWEAAGVEWDAATVDTWVRFSFCGAPGSTAALLRAGAEVFEPVEPVSDLVEPPVDSWPRRVRHALDPPRPTASVDWLPERSVWAVAAPSPRADDLLELARATLGAPWLEGPSSALERRAWAAGVPGGAVRGERRVPVAIETTVYLWTLPGGSGRLDANAEIAAGLLGRRLAREGWLGCGAVPSVVETAIACAIEGEPPPGLERTLTARFDAEEAEAARQAWILGWFGRYDPTPLGGDCLTAHAARSMWTSGSPALSEDLPGPGGARALQRDWLSRKRLGVVVLRPEGP